MNDQLSNMSRISQEDKSVISESRLLPEERERWWATILPVFLAILSVLPVLIIPYLPMTDLPQHFAILSILRNLRDPSYGFSQYYEYDFTKNLYMLPYLIAWALTYVMPLEVALRSVVFLSLIVYPLGLIALLRTLRKPAVLALLAIPLVYNFNTFWGLINISLAMGTSFFVLALFHKERPSLVSEITLGVLCLLVTVTHLYGISLIIGYTVLWAIFGEGKNTVKRYLPLVPCLVGVTLWALAWGKGWGIDIVRWTPIKDKVFKLENSVLGGYKDWSETWILCGFTFIVVLFLLYGLWIHRKALAQFLRGNLVFWIWIVGNFVAYLILPLHIPTAKFIYPRHAVLAFCFLPLVVPADFLRKLPTFSRTLLLCLALISIGNGWFHYFRFDYEAHSFNHIIEKTPRRAKIIQITLDPYGQVMMTAPYLHFLAYIQGKKGGFIATSFAMYSWLAPIKTKAKALSEIAIIPETFEWRPDFYDYNAFGYYYNYVVVRGYNPLFTALWKTLPYRLVYEVPPWRLYKSTDSP
jgi:hypothetical protein